MTLEIALTLGLLVAAIALFISNRFPPEVVALDSAGDAVAEWPGSCGEGAARV
jgi:hypothetical protein